MAKYSGRQGKTVYIYGMRITCRAIALTLLFLLPTLHFAQRNGQSPFAGRYADDFAPGEVEVEAGYQTVITRTPDGLFIKRTYFPETEQLIHYAVFADKKLRTQTGAYRSYYDEGGPRTEGQYVDDQLEGPYRTYDAEGNLSSEGSYRGGRRDSIWTEFYDDGTVRRTTAYVEGQEEGWAYKYDSTGAAVDSLRYAAGEVVEGDETSFRIDAQDGLYKIVGTMPYFPGCKEDTPADQKQCSDRKMLEFIYSQVRYPARAREYDVEGMAVVSFVVEKSGEITNLHSVLGVSEDIRDEVFRVVSLMPRWEPGLQEGEPVRVQFNLPVKFKLE